MCAISTQVCLLCLKVLKIYRLSSKLLKTYEMYPPRAPTRAAMAALASELADRGETQQISPFTPPVHPRSTPKLRGLPGGSGTCLEAGRDETLRSLGALGTTTHPNRPRDSCERGDEAYNWERLLTDCKVRRGMGC